MRLVRKTAAFVLAAIALIPGAAIAASNEFDIDLKELRHGWGDAQPKHNKQPPAPASAEIDLKELRKVAPPLPAKPARSYQHTSPAVGRASAVAAEPGHESIHVVRQGEHLFLILMQHYGLSNRAAELLIPEVMRLNGVTSPKDLKVGQRLRIPLPYKNSTKGAAPLAATAETNLPAPAAVDIPALTAATEVPDPPVAATPTSPPPAPEPGSISVIPAPPCVLAHDLLEKLGLLAPSTISIHGVETVSAVSAGQSVTVACGLSGAEVYTYERLLNRNGKRLIPLDENESADCVVEKLASHLGLVFSKQGNESESSSASYYFEPFAAWTHGLQLTIAPVPRDTDRKVKDNPDSPKE